MHYSGSPGVHCNPNYGNHSTDKEEEDTDVIIEKVGLVTVTLIGIIVGVLLAIGFIGGIIFAVVCKI